MSPMLQNSLAIWKPTLVWTLMFRNLLDPSLRITILAGIDTLYGIKIFWLKLSLSFNAIRKNDCYDFRKIFALGLPIKGSYLDRFYLNYYPIKI